MDCDNNRLLLTLVILQELELTWLMLEAFYTNGLIHYN